MPETLRFDLSGLAKVCTWGLYLVVVTELAVVAHNLDYLGFLNALETGEVDYAKAESIDQRAIVLTVAYLIAFVGTMILASVWTYQSSWNARQIQPWSQRITPGWAVGWHAIPFATYWMPFKAMRQVWNSSHDPMGDIERPVPGFLGWWWAAWVVSILVGNIATTVFTEPQTIEDFRAAIVIELVLSPATVISAILFARVIKGISEAQRDTLPAAVPQPIPADQTAEPVQGGAGEP